MNRSIICLFTALFALGACAHRGEKSTSTEGVDVAVNETRAGFGDAILAPAEDLNLKRDEIPDILKNLNQVYTLPEDLSCELIAEEVKNLTAVLGPDDDAPKAGEASRSEKVGKGAADLTLGAVSGATTGFIPFRSLVRRATGATAYEKRIRAAYQRGVQRRSFLKGVGSQILCAPPAAPRPYPIEEADETNTPETS